MRGKRAKQIRMYATDAYEMGYEDYKGQTVRAYTRAMKRRWRKFKKVIL